MSLNERPQGGDSGRALKPMAGALTGGERGRWSPWRHAEEKAPEDRGRGQSDAAPSRGEPGTPGSWERQGGPGRRASGAGRPSRHLVPRTAGERPSVALSPQVRGRVLRRPQEAVPPPDFFARPGQGATALRGAVCFERSTSGEERCGRPLRSWPRRLTGPPCASGETACVDMFFFFFLVRLTAERFEGVTVLRAQTHGTQV